MTVSASHSWTGVYPSYLSCTQLHFVFPGGNNCSLPPNPASLLFMYCFNPTTLHWLNLYYEAHYRVYQFHQSLPKLSNLDQLFSQEIFHSHSSIFTVIQRIPPPHSCTYFPVSGPLIFSPWFISSFSMSTPQWLP